MISGLLNRGFPKPKSGKLFSKLLSGVLTFEHKRMLWWDDPTKEDGKILAELCNPEIKTISTFGIHICGFEPAGIDKAGREILKYQEWWITKNPPVPVIFEGPNKITNNENNN